MQSTFFAILVSLRESIHFARPYPLNKNYHDLYLLIVTPHVHVFLRRPACASSDRIWHRHRRGGWATGVHRDSTAERFHHIQVLYLLNGKIIAQADQQREDTFDYAGITVAVGLKGNVPFVVRVLDDLAPVNLLDMCGSIDTLVHDGNTSFADRNL